MKTAVSLPDDVYERAERAARRLGRTRSAFYADALRDYLERLDHGPDAVTARLDEVYGDAPESTALGAEAGRRLVETGAWPW